MAGVMLRKGRDQQGNCCRCGNSTRFFRTKHTSRFGQSIRYRTNARTVEIVDDTLTHTGDTLTPETVVERKHETATLR